jgi:hypothetical protein
MTNPQRLPVPGLGEEVLINERSMFRIKSGDALHILVARSLVLVETIRADPMRFATAEFGKAAQQLKRFSDELTKQETALMQEVFATPSEGKVRAFYPGTKTECLELLGKFRTTLLPFVDNFDTEFRTDVALPGGLTLPTLSQPYKFIFGQGRWFELVCYHLIQHVLIKSKTRNELVFDVNVLGRSGIWHEVDLLLVIRDFSACLQASSGKWGRTDVLQLLAQREDTASDLGILLGSTPTGEDFEPVSRAHPIHTFVIQGKGAQAFVDWLADAV